MASAVMGDAAVPSGAQKEHLVFPGIRAQRPAVAEHHGLSAPPVLVVDLRAVLGRDRAHGLPSSDLRHAAVYEELDPADEAAVVRGEARRPVSRFTVAYSRSRSASFETSPRTAVAFAPIFRAALST